MEWWMLFLMGLGNSATPAVPAAALLTPSLDAMTLYPMVEPEEEAEAEAAAQPPAGSSVYVERLLSLEVEPKAVRPRPQGLAKFIYEPVYSSNADRLGYQTGIGLGIGVTTDASWTISQSVRLSRGLDLSFYYAHPLGVVSPEADLSADPKAIPPAPSAGIQLQWKF